MNPAPVQINPQEVARMTLGFFDDCPLHGRDVERFSLCKQFLMAIVQGELIVMQPPQAQGQMQGAPPPDAPAPSGRNGNSHARE